ncbi:cell division protein FtsA [Sandarakinorhabdus sp.]|uniref:cell division protein FtsA n=1 Tax=Sandarakinorhabdus sp. TaxID=1916663 RepID=UPI00286DBAA4|nr:cell division protein FtsA [Sandarakinorhabdus sp.]
MAVRIPSRLPLTAKAGGERLVAVLDVGTSKVAALIALIGPDGEPRVIGTGQKPCFGLRRGLVTDFDKTEAAIRGAMDQAERAAGQQLDRVYASISAGNLTSTVVSVEIDIAGASITSADMATLRDEGRARINPGNKTVVHAQPALYTLDGQAGVESPIGFHADRLGMDIHVVAADTPPLKNLDRAIRQAHLGLETLVAAPLAASLSVLHSEECDVGVALVEIGAGVTTVAVHRFGMLVGVAAIPMGANDITTDLAAAFATRRSVAERLKALDGAAMAVPKDNHEAVEIPPVSDDGHAEPLRVPKAQIIGVIRHRLDLLFREVARALDGQGFSGPQARQVVLTGGGAELRGIADFAAGALGRNVRIGRPRGLTGLPPAQGGPAVATLAGLVLFAAQERGDIWHAGPRAVPQPSTGSGKIANLIEKLRGGL